MSRIDEWEMMDLKSLTEIMMWSSSATRKWENEEVETDMEVVRGCLRTSGLC